MSGRLSASETLVGANANLTITRRSPGMRRFATCAAGWRSASATPRIGSSTRTGAGAGARHSPCRTTARGATTIVSARSVGASRSAAEGHWLGVAQVPCDRRHGPEGGRIGRRPSLGSEDPAVASGCRKWQHRDRAPVHAGRRVDRGRFRRRDATPPRRHQRHQRHQRHAGHRNRQRGIDSDFEVKQSRVGRRALHGTIGSGKGRIKIESGSGSVRLLRGRA